MTRGRYGKDYSFSYRLLRPSDVKFLTEWDGPCFSYDHEIGGFVTDLVGDSIRERRLNLAWHITKKPETRARHRSLRIFNAELPNGIHGFTEPFII